jgi:hypothetical protein
MPIKLLIIVAVISYASTIECQRVEANTIARFIFQINQIAMLTTSSQLNSMPLNQTKKERISCIIPCKRRHLRDREEEVVEASMMSCLRIFIAIIMTKM